MDNEVNIFQLRERVAAANRVLGYWYKLQGVDTICAHIGHVSARVPGHDLFLVKGRPLTIDVLIKTTTISIITVNFDGKKVEGQPDVTPPAEIELHANIYKARSDAGGICHAHPRFAILASILDIPIKPICNEGLDIFPIVIYKDNALISTDEHGRGIVNALGGAFTCLLRGHGAVTIADSPEKATLNMIYLEEQARLNIYALWGVGKDYPSIPNNQVKNYLLFRKAILKQRLRGKLEENLWEYLKEKASQEIFASNTFYKDQM